MLASRWRAPTMVARRCKSDLTIHQIKPLTGLSESVLNLGGGRSSLSGITATVFGASGFVSRYVCNRLARIGSQVMVPYRGDGLEVRHLKLMGDLGQVVPLEYDLKDRNSITRAMARSNVVINLVGQRRETINYSYDDVHNKAARMIAECAREAGVERLIHFSSLGADPNSASDFFRSKGQGEQSVLTAFPDATIMRPAPVFGPEDSLLLRYAALIHHDTSLPFLQGHLQKMQPVSVGDVAAAVVTSILEPSTKGRVVELAGPDTLTDLQVAHRVVQILQEDVELKILDDATYRRFLTIKQYEPHFRKYYPANLYDPLKHDLVATGAPEHLTLRDLGLSAAPLEKFIEFSLKTQEHKEIDTEYGLTTAI